MPKINYAISLAISNISMLQSHIVIFAGLKIFLVYMLCICLSVCTKKLLSLGRPEIFEKVAKIGVGVHIWLLQVSKLTHH